MESTPLYSLRVQDVYHALETSPEGLSEEEVESRRSLYGPNVLEAPAPQNHWKNFSSHIRHPISLLLWVAGFLAFFANQPALGIIIWVLILVNAGFSFWREYRAEQAIEALRHLLPSYARVIRARSETQVPASEIVPGDVLVLAEGDYIPADARIVEEYGLRTNNANLTGEAMPARKTADASVLDGLSEVERPNLVFAGTSVVSGTGRAIAYATGMLTQFGRIATLTQAVREEPSLIQQEFVHLQRKLSILALAIGTTVFVVGAFDVGLELYDSFLLAIGIIAAVAPEGLPAIITLTLAMAGQRLAQRGVLVKKLSIIEALGTISIICTDKSGTLTQNQMTVREIWVGRERLNISGIGYEPKGTFTPSPGHTYDESDLRALLQAALLCNNSRLTPPTPEKPAWTSLGDQTEVALRVAALKGSLAEKELNQELPRVHELPFDARRKRMSTLHRNPDGEVAFTKGAPREILQLCSYILINGERQLLTESLRQEILAANDDYARSALRVLALARRDLSSALQGARLRTSEAVECELTFLGLMAMMDPPRPEVAEAVKICRQAGIRIAMITGDYGLTAESLARRVGMLATPNPLIITGSELDAMNDIELRTLLDREVIFARMAPEHKLRLVAAYQARGEVVAVTGDGVNDAPALRKADVGVAMGQVGTGVAKEAADIILTDDNFSKIVTAIEEGRAIYDNLRKFVTYIFSSNVPEVLPFILTALFNIPPALTVMQILAIDLGTDLLPALALGTEKPEPNVMRRPPRRPGQRLIDKRLLTRAFIWLGMIEATLCYIGFLAVFLFVGDLPISQLLPHNWDTLPQAMARVTPWVYGLAITAFHAGVVTSQVGNAFACRTEKMRGRHLGWLSNPFIIVGVFAELAIILALIYFPPLAHIFDHQPLPASYWPWLLSYALILYSLDWVRKAFVRYIEEPKAGKVNGVREIS